MIRDFDDKSRLARGLGVEGGTGGARSRLVLLRRDGVAVLVAALYAGH